jgi:acyl-CoA thioesterase-1
MNQAIPLLLIGLITPSTVAQQTAATLAPSTGITPPGLSQANQQQTISPGSQNLEPDSKNARPLKPLDPGLAQVADVPGLPRVLIIGDSISMGYTPPVRAKLDGKANIHHPPMNCGDSQRALDKADRHAQTGPDNLEKWLGKDHWDVILFNFGLHDLKYTDGKGRYISPEDGGIRDTPPSPYAKNLQEIAARLQKTGAKVVFVTTTPVPPGCTGRVAGDEKIYNEVALGVMKPLNIPVADLCGFVVEKQRDLPPRPANEAPKSGEHHAISRPGEIQLPFNVHFTPEGYDQLADIIVSSIQKSLPIIPGK